MQIMVGLFYVGFGVIRESRETVQVRNYWPGICFMVFGVMCILSEKFPSPCVVAVSVLMNLVGVALAITAIVLCSINLANLRRILRWMCYNRTHYEGTLSPRAVEEKAIQETYLEKCREGKELFIMLFSGLDVLLIILAVLQVCLSFTASALGIKALRRNQKENMETTKTSDRLLLKDCTV
ncbi:uncharacterized protein tmem176l.1 isoform X2 [Lampris incognitus]|nr:uncharacterized protein tmem176l.1 isoform X2 [Lampris incognitus]